MKNLIYHEFLVQNKVYNLTKYTILFFSFCLISTLVVNSPEYFQKFGIILSVIYIPLAFLGLSANIIKADLDDGNLECLLACTTAFKIILAKFLVLSLNTSASFAIILPFLKIFFNLDFYCSIILYCLSTLLLFISSALIILIAAIQSYFKSNTNFFTLLIMPLFIPSIILAGICIQDMQNLYLLFIMFGINLVLIPPSLYLSGYLINNIYNI
ncbi:MAG: hypothetical protein EKK61_01535 [Rickettsiales bacterium]|nr:MAG: hypothetical protein EKK61_01535 [Rickettsiales bacterium]